MVEKFAGDAVMAAFGIPQAHEDDAERAMRAALAILDAVHELELEARIGIESGEVVVDDGDSTFATGEAVNLAARLQQVAEPGQILIGPAAHSLTIGKLEVDDVGPVEVRGRASPSGPGPPCPRRRSAGRSALAEAPFIGRDAELELLENTYARALRDRRAHLFTIYGEPGVGKTRLAREFLDAIEGATVLVGRCLPYGESITYWPLAEMVKGAAGIADDDPLDVAHREAPRLLPRRGGRRPARARDRRARGGPRRAQPAGDRLGGARVGGAAWPRRQPLVLVFEDIHWAEEPLLELIEHLDRLGAGGAAADPLPRPARAARRAPGLGRRPRPRDLDRARAARRGGERAARRRALAATATLAARRAARRCSRRPSGNPLFVEETMRMLVE